MYTIPAYLVFFLIVVLAVVATQGTDVLDVLLTTPK